MYICTRCFPSAGRICFYVRCMMRAVLSVVTRWWSISRLLPQLLEGHVVLRTTAQERRFLRVRKSNDAHVLRNGLDSDKTSVLLQYV